MRLGKPWALLALSAAVAGPLRVEAAPARPNVVFIIADDLNCALGCYGNADAKSPNVDRLAGRGMLFQHAYCQFPVCNPSRTCLFTGLIPEHTNVFGNGGAFTPGAGDAPLMPRYFRDSGYYTMRVGKVFHDSRRVLEGKPIRSTDDPASWDVSEDEPAEAEEGEEGARADASPEKRVTQLDAKDEATGDGIVVRRASELLGQHAKDQRPFFLAVGVRKPHLPWNAPKKYFEMYPPEKLHPVIEPAEHLKTLLPMAVNKYFKAEPTPDAEARHYTQAYYACVSYTDAQVGYLLDALTRLKLDENTIIVLTSDHGFHNGEHGLWSKNTLFEESARVPLIFVVPGNKAGECGHIVEMADIYPTLTDLCSLPRPPKLDGRSMKGLIDDPGAAWKDVAYTMLRRGDLFGRSIRNARYRYTEWDEGRQGVELYDHEADPGEHHNLASDPAYARVKKQMKLLMFNRVQGTP